MFKKLLMIAFVVAMPVAHACDYRYSAVLQVQAVIVAHGGAPKLQPEKCRALEAAGMQLQIDGSASVLAHIPVGWVLVSVIDGNRVISTTYRMSTSVDPKQPGSINRARELVYEGLVTAVRDLDVSRAIGEVREARGTK